MPYYECPNDQCRVAIFLDGSAGFVTCPQCWTSGARLDTGTVDDLLRALDKRVPAEQMPLFDRSGHAAA